MAYPEGTEAAVTFPIGINIARVTPQSTDKQFKNWCKQASPWNYYLIGWYAPATNDLDDNGYVNNIPSGAVAYSVVMADWYNDWKNVDSVPKGEFVFTYDGEGVIDIYLGHTVIYNAPSGTKFDNTSGFIKFEIKSVTEGNHPRNFKLVETTYENDDLIDPFYPEFVESVRGFKYIRPAIWWVDNGYDSDSGELSWSDRTQSSYYSYSGQDAYPKACHLPWELFVDLANRIGADVHVIIPYLANTDYLQNFVEALSLVDGKVWFEFSNEAWHDSSTIAGLYNCEYFLTQGLALFGSSSLVNQLKAHAHYAIQAFETIMACSEYDVAKFKFAASYPPDVLPSSRIDSALTYTPDSTPFVDYLDAVMTMGYWNWWTSSEATFNAMLDACNGDENVFLTDYVFPSLSGLFTEQTEWSSIPQFYDYIKATYNKSVGIYEWGPSVQAYFAEDFVRFYEYVTLFKASCRNSRLRYFIRYFINRISSYSDSGVPCNFYESVSALSSYETADGIIIPGRIWGMAEDLTELDTAPKYLGLKDYAVEEEAQYLPEILGLSPNSNVCIYETSTTITFDGTPTGITEFLARADGADLLDTTIVDDVWFVTIPATVSEGSITVEISIDGGVTWHLVPDGFTYLANPVITGLSPSTGVYTKETTTTILWSGTPLSVTSFLARINGSTSVDTLISGSSWQIIMPVNDSVETVTVEISTDGGATWELIPGGFNYIDISCHRRKCKNRPSKIKLDCPDELADDIIVILENFFDATQIKVFNPTGYSIDPFTEEVTITAQPTWFNVSGIVGNVNEKDSLLGFGGKVKIGDLKITYPYSMFERYINCDIQQIRLIASGIAGIYNVSAKNVDIIMNVPMYIDFALAKDRNE